MKSLNSFKSYPHNSLDSPVGPCRAWTSCLSLRSQTATMLSAEPVTSSCSATLMSKQSTPENSDTQRLWEQNQNTGLPSLGLIFHLSQLWPPCCVVSVCCSAPPGCCKKLLFGIRTGSRHDWSQSSHWLQIWPITDLKVEDSEESRASSSE